MGIFDNGGGGGGGSSANLKFIQSGAGAVVRTAQDKMRERLAVADFGAKGNGITDDIQAFNDLRDEAQDSGRAMWINPLPPGRFYRLSTDWKISNFQNFRIYGDGVLSLLVAYNANGDNAITIDNSAFGQIKGIGVEGIVDSGHGIQYRNASHELIFDDIFVGWMGLNGLEATEGISPIFIKFRAYQDIGYDPAGLGTNVRGNNLIGISIPSHPSGLNNNATFIGCKAEANKNIDLSIGHGGVPVVDSAAWWGGTIQGAQSFKGVYLHAVDVTIIGAHIEPRQGATSNYMAEFDGCVNCHIADGSLQGDVLMQGSEQCTVSGARLSGVTVTDDCIDCGLVDGQIGSTNTGPAAGAISDQGRNTIITAMIDASKVQAGHGYWPGQTDVSGFTGRNWDGTVVPGWTNFGSALSQVTANGNLVIRQQISTAGFTEYLAKDLGPIESIRGRWITVDAYLTNANGAGKAFIAGLFNNSGTTFIESTVTNGTEERVQAAFYVSNADTSFQIQLTGLNTADIQWRNVTISIQNFEPAPSFAIAGGATPALGGYGYQLPTYTDAGSGTAITGFTTAEIGKPFTIEFSGARTLTHSATLILSLGINFVAKAGDTITLVYGADAVYREVSRMVS